MNHKTHLVSFALLMAITLTACAGEVEAPTPRARNDETSSNTDFINNQPTSEGSAFRISVDTPQKLPDDIPEHLAFGGRGGGSFPGCISIDHFESSSKVFDYHIPLGKANWCFCKLNEPVGQSISASLTFPNGSSKKIEVEVSEEPFEISEEKCVKFTYQFPETAEQKKHTFEVALSGRQVSENFIPFVDVYPFYGWKPNERIRILVFDQKGELVFLTEQKTRVNESGEIKVKLSDTEGKNPAIVIIGESGMCLQNTSLIMRSKGYGLSCGEFFDRERNINWEDWLRYDPSQLAQKSTPTTASDTGPWEACPNIYLSRLRVGDRAYVNLDPPLANRVRSEPNTQGNILGLIQPGEEMEITDGPKCANNWVWWKVRAATGLVGWTAEGDREEYWLVPIP